MDINCGRVFKPNRILYYIKPTEQEKRDFYSGKIPEVLAAFEGAFGTYDNPGLFLLNDGEKQTELLGIEFRPNDSRISYPKGLASVMLPQGFMISASFLNVDEFNDETICDCIEQVQNKIDVLNFYWSTLKPLENPDIIQISTFNNHNRILIKTKDISAEELFKPISPVSETEKQLFNLAYRDGLTGHYNWNYIWPIIAGYGLKGIQDFTFVHFDIKDFKAINIVYGHAVANYVLDRLVKHMNETDWIYYSARCDNDNFAMMIKDMPEEETRQKLLQFFDEISVLEEDKNYRIYYRCGVVPMRNTLLLGDRVADAGKQVQRLGNKLYETEVLFYTDSMHDTLDWSTKTRYYLDTAIKQDEFLVYLQPKFDIKTEKLHGAEALIRWKYHGRELLSPARFIPIFETGGLISKLDDIVLKKVCSYLKKWREQGLELHPISVNLSRKSMGDHDLVEHLTAIVDGYGVDRSLIDFELTESAAYDNQDYMISVIKALKERGFKISIDDFGTGYSSLSLLTAMPIDTIKIDKSFVDRIGSSEEARKDCAVLKHIIAMVKDLNFTCLAEGAETKEQVELLREFGCEVVQGYYYSKPLPVEDYEQKLN